MHSFQKLIATTLVALVAGTATFSAAQAFDPGNKEQLGHFIRDYIVSHPEVLIEAQDALQKKQAAQQRDQVQAEISANHDAIFDAPGDLVIGNPDGDVTLVEFYDYNCPYCKHAVPDMQALVKSDDSLKFVLKEFPVLGDDSVAASRASIAVQMVAPDKYRALHDALMANQARANGDTALNIAESLGIDRSAIEKAMKSPAVGKRIKQAYALADKLNITGTPAYVVGDQAVSGALGADALEKKVDNVRKCDSATC